MSRVRIFLISSLGAKYVICVCIFLYRFLVSEINKHFSIGSFGTKSVITIHIIIYVFPATKICQHNLCISLCVYASEIC